MRIRLFATVYNCLQLFTTVYIYLQLLASVYNCLQLFTTVQTLLFLQTVSVQLWQNATCTRDA